MIVIGSCLPRWTTIALFYTCIAINILLLDIFPIVPENKIKKKTEERQMNNIIGLFGILNILNLWIMFLPWRNEIFGVYMILNSYIACCFLWNISFQNGVISQWVTTTRHKDARKKKMISNFLINILKSLQLVLHHIQVVLWQIQKNMYTMDHKFVSISRIFHLFSTCTI